MNIDFQFVCWSPEPTGIPLKTWRCSQLFLFPTQPRQHSDLGDQMALEVDQANIEFLKSELMQHTLPSVSLGTTGGTLAHKFHAALHSIFLEAGTSEEDLARYCSEICACTTDMGTEFALPLVAPMPVAEVFPWLKQETREGPVWSCDMDDFALVAAEHCSPAAEVSFCSALAFPGLLHIIHNAASDMLTVTEVLDGQVDCLAKVCALLSDRQNCTKLMERCFNEPVGKQLQHKLASFFCKVYRPRWGSVAYCCRALLEVKPVLLFGWSLEKFQGDGKKVGPDLEAANNSITSNLFWASLFVLDRLYELVRSCFEWAEGCQCHSHLDWGDVSKDIRERWEACPLRGLRAPEVCAGDFFAVFNKLQNEATVSVAAALNEVSTINKARLIQEFERCRSFVFHTFTLKLSAFSAPPLVISAIAHHSKVVAHDALRVCLQCVDDHPQIKLLQSEPLKFQAERFLDGTELIELPDLCAFMAGLRFSHVVERKVEGGHAKILRRGRAATQHTEAFDSLALRVSEICKHLDSDSKFLQSLSDLVGEARSPKQLVQRLGFGFHPACCNVRKHPWNKLWRQIVYRADKATLYRCNPPQIVIQEVPNHEAPLEQPEPQQLVSLDQSACYTAVLRDTALAFFHTQVQQLESSEAFRIYSCQAVPAATVPLQRKLHEQANLASVPLPVMLPGWVGGDCKLWFSIVSTAPYRSKRARTGSLTKTDLAISVHRCLDSNASFAYVLTTPVNLEYSEAAGVPVEQVPLVLTTHMFDLQSLKQASSWEVAQETFFVLDTGDPELTFDETASGLLASLVENKSFQLTDEHPLAYAEHLSAWKE